jgi:hypothetical protein
MIREKRSTLASYASRPLSAGRAVLSDTEVLEALGVSRRLSSPDAKCLETLIAIRISGLMNPEKMGTGNGGKQSAWKTAKRKHNILSW